MFVNFLFFMDIKQEKEIATQIIRQAGEIAKTRFADLSALEIAEKSKHEIVTSVDEELEEIIISKLQFEFPEHSILSEEEGEIEGDSEYLWVVDPLDGTTNFSLKNPFFSISIGLFYKKEPALGFIYAPITEELYSAQKDKTATLEGEKMEVSKLDTIEEATLAFCHGYEEKYLDKATKLYSELKVDSRTLRQFGAASLEMAMVASGRLDAFMIPGVNAWDVAAGVLMVREAGGKVTDFEGNEWDLDSKNILASNGETHQQLLERLQNL